MSRPLVLRAYAHYGGHRSVASCTAAVCGHACGDTPPIVLGPVRVDGSSQSSHYVVLRWNSNRRQVRRVPLAPRTLRRFHVRGRVERAYRLRIRPDILRVNMQDTMRDIRRHCVGLELNRS